MLIRSQDKHGFINLENIDTVCMDENWCIYAFNGKADSILGAYSAEENAIKVLDMIQNSYQYCEECKYIGVGASQPEFTFQMPQDNEV